MPPTQRKLTSFPVSKKPLKFQGSTQKRLEELKKVVSIKGGSVNFDIEELAIAKAVIESEDSSSEELLESLRRLSCFQITGEMLRSSGVGYSIRYVHFLESKAIHLFSFFCQPSLRRTCQCRQIL